MSIHLVYKIESTFSDDFYIGRKTVKKLSQFDSYWSLSKRFKKFINEHGKENFKKEILFIFDSEEDQVEKENYLNLVFYKDNLNCWSRGTFTGMVSTAMKKRVEDKIHNFLGGKISRKMIEDGTHPFLDGSISRETQNRRVKDGTHHLLGKSNPSHKRVIEGTHNFQRGINKNKMWINNGEKNKLIYPKDFDLYSKDGFFKGMIKK
jgi:hypothetical protein